MINSIIMGIGFGIGFFLVLITTICLVVGGSVILIKLWKRKQEKKIDKNPDNWLSQLVVEAILKKMMKGD